MTTWGAVACIAADAFCHTLAVIRHARAAYRVRRRNDAVAYRYDGDCVTRIPATRRPAAFSRVKTGVVTHRQTDKFADVRRDTSGQLRVASVVKSLSKQRLQLETRIRACDARS